VYILPFFLLADIIILETTWAQSSWINTCGKGLELEGITIPRKNITCLPNNGDELLGFRIEKDKPWILVTSDTNIDLTSKEFSTVFGQDNFSLIIDGICWGMCSRLLLPLSDEVVFTKNSVAVLSDSSIDSWTHNGIKIVMPDTFNSHKTATPHSGPKSFKESYEYKVRHTYLVDIELLLDTRVNIAHLTWHTSMRQVLKNKHPECLPIRSFAVILTPKYLRVNGIITKEQMYNYKLPKFDEISTEFYDTFGTETLAVYAYTPELLAKCQP